MGGRTRPVLRARHQLLGGAGGLVPLIGIEGEDTLARIDAALLDAVGQRAPGRFREIYPYLTRFLDLPTPSEFEELLRRVSGELLHARMFEAFSGLVAATAQQRPVVLAFEDLHWADPSSLRLLRALLPLTLTLPVTVLMAYRPDERGVTVQNDVLTAFAGMPVMIDLQPLTPAQSARLVRQLLAVENMPATTQRLILDRAEGNPFFVEEVLRSLIESGVVTLQGGRAVAVGEIDALSLPTTLQGILMARLDRLPAESRRSLQTAAVIGRLFQERLLAHVRALEQGRARSMTEPLEELRRREFIHARTGPPDEATGELEWMFKHAVTHEVAYGSLLLERRKHMHGAVGDAIEVLFSDRRDELAASLGYHFAHAGRAAAAVHYLTRAGLRAKTTFANAEAVAFFRAAIEEFDRAAPGTTIEETRAELLEHLADLLALRGEHDEARDAFDRALASDPPPNGLAAARLRRKRGEALVVRRMYTQALEDYRLATQHIGQSDAARSGRAWWHEMLDLQLALMWLYYWQGQTVDMTEIAESFAEDFQQRGTGRQRAHFFMQLTLRNLRRDLYTVNEDTLRLAEQLRQTLGDVEELVQVPHFAFVVGFAALWHGNLDAARSHLGDALRSGEQIGDVVVQLRCVTYLAVAWRKSGGLRQCEEFARRGLELATRMKMSEYIAMGRATLAWAACRSGDLEGGARLARLALDEWHNMPVPYAFDWMAAWPLIAWHASRGDHARGIDIARLALAPEQQPMPAALAERTALAVSAWDEGVESDAAQFLTEALEIARQWGYA